MVTSLNKKALITQGFFLKLFKLKSWKLERFPTVNRKTKVYNLKNTPNKKP